jgi:putative membrane protein
VTVAHEIVRPGALWTAWSPQLSVTAGLLLSGAVYGMGAWRLRARRPRGLRLPARVTCFFMGLAMLALALISPLDALGATLFSAHMVQHLVLILVAAPLLVFGAPAPLLSMGLPQPVRRPLNRTAHRLRVRRTLRLSSGPVVVWLLHVAGLWVWHLPSLYEEALSNELVHVGEHATFFGTALLFWGEVFGRRRPGRLGGGLRVVYVFTAALSSAALGAILTFATVALYPIHATGVGAWGLTLLRDQQLAGVIMWVPAGAVYLVIMTVLFLRWLRDMDDAALTPDAEKSLLPMELGRR